MTSVGNGDVPGFGDHSQGEGGSVGGGFKLICIITNSIDCSQGSQTSIDINIGVTTIKDGSGG